MTDLRVLPSSDRLDWLRWRRLGIGASDAAAVCGLSRWDTPFTIWLEKTGQLPLQERENPEQRWGKLLEPAIIDAFEEDMSLEVTDRQAPVVHPEHDWQRATLDGRVPAVGALFEGKTSHGWDWRDGVPRHFALQVQHQMAVDGAQAAYLAVLIGGSDFQVHEVPRHERTIRILTELEHDFWHENVVKRKPPTVDGSERTARAIKEAFPAPTRTRCDLPKDAVGIVREYCQGRALERRGKAQAEEAQNRLTALLGEAEEGWVGDELVCRWPLQTQVRKAQPARTITFRRLWLPSERRETT